MDEGGGGGGSVRILIAIDLFGLFLIFIILLSFTMKMCCIYTPTVEVSPTAPVCW